MKTDVIVVSTSGKQMEDALKETEKFTNYKQVSPKTALHLQLLTEEMMGMMRSITGEKEGEFWIEDKDGMAELHLRMNTILDFQRKDQLIAASTSGKNEATRSFMGKLRAFFDASASVPLITLPLMPGVDAAEMYDALEWSLEDYKLKLEKYRDENGEGAEEAWDELEKSVVTHVADEVKVSVDSKSAEMIIFKKIA